MVLLYLILVVISLMIFGVVLRSAMMRFVLLSARHHHHNTRFSMLQIYVGILFRQSHFQGGGWFVFFKAFT